MAEKLAKACEREYKEKLLMKEKELSYYREMIGKFGLKAIDRVVKYLPESSSYMKKGITFAHLDFEKIVTAIVNKEKFAVVSGLSPTGPLHFGHKVVFEEVLWLQKQGADVYIPVTDDEAYATGKIEKLSLARKYAYEEVIPSILALGFDQKKTYIFTDTDYNIYPFAIDVAKKITLNKVKKIFGFEDSENAGLIFYRGAVQVAQILLPFLKEFNAKQVVIPVGIDQHPYILLARDIAKNLKFSLPAGLYMKFLHSLGGPKDKMSASKPHTCIYLTEKPNVAEEKIKNAFTGGYTLEKIQREKGGIPEICSIFGLLQYNFLDSDQAKKLYEKCTSGSILCEECKEVTKKYVKKYLAEHKEKKERIKENIDKYILKKPITSIL